MSISLASKFGVDELSRNDHYASRHGAAVWRLSLAVLLTTNSLLLFFLYIYDVI